MPQNDKELIEAAEGCGPWGESFIRIVFDTDWLEGSYVSMIGDAYPAGFWMAIHLAAGESVATATRHVIIRERMYSRSLGVQRIYKLPLHDPFREGIPPLDATRLRRMLRTHARAFGPWFARYRYGRKWPRLDKDNQRFIMHYSFRAGALAVLAALSGNAPNFDELVTEARGLALPLQPFFVLFAELDELTQIWHYDCRVVDARTEFNVEDVLGVGHALVIFRAKQVSRILARMLGPQAYLAFVESKKKGFTWRIVLAESSAAALEAVAGRSIQAYCALSIETVRDIYEKMVAGRV